jgi:hypothetical protein
MLLAGIGILAAIVTRVVLETTGLADFLAAQLLVCVSTGLMVAVLTWLLFGGSARYGRDGCPGSAAAANTRVLPFQHGGVTRPRRHDRVLAHDEEPPLGSHLVTPRLGLAHHGTYVGHGRRLSQGRVPAKLPQLFAKQ